jgi:hypothetical protein
MACEPLAAVVVNVPGEMATLVAPEVTQRRVLPEPALTLVGVAVKLLMIGFLAFRLDAAADVTSGLASLAAIK